MMSLCIIRRGCHKRLRCYHGAMASLALRRREPGKALQVFLSSTTLFLFPACGCLAVIYLILLKQGFKLSLYEIYPVFDSWNKQRGNSDHNSVFRINIYRISTVPQSCIRMLCLIYNPLQIPVLEMACFPNTLYLCTLGYPFPGNDLSAVPISLIQI